MSYGEKCISPILLPQYVIPHRNRIIISRIFEHPFFSFDREERGACSGTYCDANHTLILARMMKHASQWRTEEEVRREGKGFSESIRAEQRIARNLEG